MIEAFRNDDIINQFGGRFKLCVLIQRRWLELMQGARPMVEFKGLTDLEIVVKEIVEGKIELATGADDDQDEDEEAGII